MSERHHHITGHAVASFTVHGVPRAQPRPRAFVRNGNVRVYDPGTAEGWKGNIALAALDFIPPSPMHGPIMLTVAFLFPRPKSHFKASGLLKDGTPSFVTKKPDLDNLVKAVMDACTMLGFWSDDKQVATISTLKRFVHGDEFPGADVTISTLSSTAPTIDN